jgi:hypothetical protein
MNTQHIKVFANVYLENNKLIDSSHLNEFISKEAQLPVDYNEILVALAELSTDGVLEPVIVTDNFAQYKKK